MKFVMCMLQDTGIFKDLIVSVPSDVQALVLLHNGVSGSNYTSEYSVCVMSPTKTISNFQFSSCNERFDSILRFEDVGSA